MDYTEIGDRGEVDIQVVKDAADCILTIDDEVVLRSEHDFQVFLGRLLAAGRRLGWSQYASR